MHIRAAAVVVTRDACGCNDLLRRGARKIAAPVRNPRI
jgi:hypothetical protein